ncbi:bifunctional folylpolyglutamate synthase/dihydrofolate synthase [Haloplasma contractile]|uniref:tetrahydrofolate synthase n=1 Tax=Haloplasma contractile SSD-17B TaxID=1033810 RepID=F7Q170_9MOLU|nr:folylpolyglutamate synthase/dihydrofolate synthase family protein [Haloplasma contractile]ERJ12787.1 Folylpolyglutamate synthase protein [Haloplasma contractile SSD-17B]
MFKTIDQFHSWLENQRKFGMKLNLNRIKYACKLLNNPQDKLKTIHIGGTNGKGSTLNYLRHLLESTGFKVGTFISPYIEVFNERIAINGVYISDDDLIKYGNEICDVVERANQETDDFMTEYEIITLLSFLYFKDHNVDYVIYEVGLGGRYDGTNVIEPIVIGITNVGYDHMNVLGNTLGEIAYEKIGIAKKGKTVYTTAKDDEVMNVFSDYSVQVGATLVKLNLDCIHNIQFNEDHTQFKYKDFEQGFTIPMLGEHQVYNVVLALNLYEFLLKERNMSLSPEYIYSGLKKAKWHGRLDVISKKPFIMVDGSHNINGIETLCAVMNQYIKRGYKITCIFAALKDKDTSKMIIKLQEITKQLVLTSFSFYRAADAYDLYNQTNKKHITYEEDFKQAIDGVVNTQGDNELLLITGSLYFTAQVLHYLKRTV